MDQEITQKLNKKINLLGKYTRFSEEAYRFFFNSFDEIDDNVIYFGGDITSLNFVYLFREYLVSRYGIIADHVLKSYGISTCGDLDEINNNLIDVGIIRKEVLVYGADQLECDLSKKVFPEGHLLTMITEEVKNFFSNPTDNNKN